MTDWLGFSMSTDEALRVEALKAAVRFVEQSDWSDAEDVVVAARKFETFLKHG